MANSRELQLEATATIEDATSKLQDLLSSIKDLPEEISTKINLDSETAESQVESIKNDIEDVPDEVTTTIDVDGDAESQIADIKSEIETIEDTVSVDIDANDNASDIADNIKSTVEELDGQISTVTINADGDALEVADEVKTDLEELDGSEVTVTINAEGASETEDDIDGASDAASDYGGILDAIFGAGATAAFSETITSAGNFESSWLKLRSAVGEGDKDMDTVMAEWESAISAMTSSTGRGAGDARDEITALGKAGVTNKQTMIDLFSGVSEASYQTGNSVSSLDDQMRILISQETPRMRTLNRQFGITDETIKNTYGSVDTFKEKWKTASADQRAEMLSTLLNQQYLSDGVADYGDSWEHSVDKAGRSLTWLGIQLGSPLLDPAKSGLNGFADIVNDIANAFGDLPGPIKTAISAFFGLTAVGKLIKGIGEFFDKLGIKIISNPMTKIGDYMLKPLKIVFDNISKLIPDSVKDWKTKIKTFVDDIKTIFEEKPKFEILSEEDGVIEEAKLNTFKSKVSSFVNDIKTKINEVKGKFKLSDIFSSEEGESTTTTFKNKISTFVNDIKTKINELKGKFRISDIFGGDGETTFIDTVKTKIENLVNTIKTKWETLKGKIKLSDIFGDEKGTIDFKFFDDIPSKLDEVLSKMKVKLPSFENIGKEIPEYLGRGIRSTLNTLVSDGAFVIIAMFQAMYDAAENWRSPIQDQIKDIFLSFDLAEWIIDSLGLGDLWDKIKLPHTTAAKLLGLDKIAKMTPEELWSYIIGDDLATKVGDFLKRDISDPLHEFVNNLLKNPIGLFSSWLKGEKIPAENLTRDIINTIKSNIDGFKDWLNTLEFPNLLDLILPQTASAAGEGKDKGNPIDTAINSIKEKINGFKDWLGSLKFSSITDLIFGKQEEGKESPITTFINDIKAKIGGFKDWLGSLKFTNILDTIFGKKSDQKEDPATTFINGIKTKLNDLKTYVQNKANEIKSALSIDWSRIESGLSEAKQWVIDRWTEIKNYLKTKIDEIKSLIKIPWEKIYDGLQAAVNTAEAIFNLFSAYMEVLGTKAKKWGSDIVQGLVDGIKEKTPTLEDALNYIKNYFPSSPPKTGPLSQITAQGTGDWIGSVFSGMYSGLSNVTSLTDALEYIAGFFPRSNPTRGPLSGVTKDKMEGWINSILSPYIQMQSDIGSYLKDVMPDSIQYHGLNTDYDNTPSSITINQGNTSQKSSGTSGWEQTPITDWTSGAITDWTSSLLDGTSGIGDWTGSLLDGTSQLNGFTDALGQASLNIADWNAGSPAINTASGNAGSPAINTASGATGDSRLNTVSETTGGSRLNTVSETTGGSRLNSTSLDRIVYPTQKVSITFESGALNFKDGDKGSVKSAITNALTNPTTLSKMRMQMSLKGYNPRTTIN
jgi:hypothetical protein